MTELTVLLYHKLGTVNGQVPSRRDRKFSYVARCAALQLDDV